MIIRATRQSLLLISSFRNHSFIFSLLTQRFVSMFLVKFDFLFKLLHLRSHDEASVVKHAREGGLEFGFEREVLGVDVEKRDHGGKNDECL